MPTPIRKTPAHAAFAAVIRHGVAVCDGSSAFEREELVPLEYNGDVSTASAMFTVRAQPGATDAGGDNASDGGEDEGKEVDTDAALEAEVLGDEVEGDVEGATGTLKEGARTRAARFKIWLRPTPEAVASWSPTWKAEIHARTDGEWRVAGHMTPATAPVEIELPNPSGASADDDSTSAQLGLVLHVQERYNDIVPLANLTGPNQYVRQSSEDAERLTEAASAWMVPTSVEWEPYWDMLLSYKMPMFVTRVRVRDARSTVSPDHDSVDDGKDAMSIDGDSAEAAAGGGARPRRAGPIKLKISMYSWTDDQDNPLHSMSIAVVDVPPDGTGVDVPVNAIGRFMRVQLHDAFGALALDGVDVFGAELHHGTLHATFRAMFSMHAEKPMFGTRAPKGRRAASGPGAAGPPVRPYRWVTYGDIYRRVKCLRYGMAPLIDGTEASAAAHDTDNVGAGASEDAAASPPRSFVAVCGRNSADWYVADVACLYGAWVSVPIPFTSDTDTATYIVHHTNAQCLLVSAECLDIFAKSFAEAEMASVKVVIVMDGEPDAALVRVVEGARPDDPVTVLTMLAVEASGATDPRSSAKDTALEQPDDPPEDALYTLMYTSGSTGRPKAAMRSYAAFNSLLHGYGVPQPAVHASFAPLSHLSERIMMPVTLLGGGMVGITSGEDIFDDIGELQPTFINAVPRFYNKLHANYELEVQDRIAESPGASREDVEERVLASFKTVLGTRLQSLAIGSAPPSKAVLEWMRKCFAGVPVTEGYGSTECGTISVNNIVPDNVEARLVDVPEMGYLTTDDPPRGEVYVRTQHMISGYFKDEAKTAAAFDDGWFRTGDIGKEVTIGGKTQLLLIGRLKNVSKLANGEFVEPERIESALLRCSIVDQIHVHASSSQAGVVAVVVPNFEVLRRSVIAAASGGGASAPREGGGDGKGSDDNVATASEEAMCGMQAVVRHAVAALQREGRDAELRTYEIPAAVKLVAERFTPENGLMTSSDKPNRAGIEKKYGSDFEALYADAETFESQLIAAASEALGHAVDPGSLVASLGVDSLSTVRIMSRVRARVGVDVPLSVWQQSASLADVAARMRGAGSAAAGSGEGTAHKSLHETVADDLARTDHIDAAVVTAGLPSHLTEASAAQFRARSVLITGCTGFMGAYVVDELLSRTEATVHCLVRVSRGTDKGKDKSSASGGDSAHSDSKGASDSKGGDGDDDAELAVAAMARIKSARLAAGLPWDASTHSKRIVPVVGDLSAPRLGLSDAAFASLARSVDLVVHAGAVVNWIMTYDQVRPANVLGTLEVLRLATTAVLKPVCFISTISTAPRGGSEAAMLPQEVVVAGGGYGLSKWVAERHVQLAARAGVPVAVVRPGMITGHATSGHSNATDFVNRYLSSVVQLGCYIDEEAILDLSPVDWVAASTVVLAQRSASYSTAASAAASAAVETAAPVYHLTLVGRSMRYVDVGAAVASCGYECARVAYPEFVRRLCNSDAAALAPLVSFFPKEGFCLGMGPYECDVTMAVLAEAGIDAPVIGPPLVRTYLRSLAWRQLVPALPGAGTDDSAPSSGRDGRRASVANAPASVTFANDVEVLFGSAPGPPTASAAEDPATGAGATTTAATPGAAGGGAATPGDASFAAYLADAVGTAMAAAGGAVGTAELNGHVAAWVASVLRADPATDLAGLLESAAKVYAGAAAAGARK